MVLYRTVLIVISFVNTIHGIYSSTYLVHMLLCHVEEVETFLKWNGGHRSGSIQSKSGCHHHQLAFLAIAEKSKFQREKITYIFVSVNKFKTALLHF